MPQDCAVQYGSHWLHGTRLPQWSSGKESTCQCRRREFDPRAGRIPWRRKWRPSRVFLPGKFTGQGTLTGYSPRGLQESDMTEQLRVHASHPKIWWLGTIIDSDYFIVSMDQELEGRLTGWLWRCVKTMGSLMKLQSWYCWGYIIWGLIDAGGSTSKIAPSHGFWHLAEVPHHMELSIELLGCPRETAAGFPPSEWPKWEQGGSHCLLWPGLGSHTDTLTTFCFLEVSH